jgi:hypothetical protein
MGIFAQAVLAKAVTQLGVEEKPRGSNKGPQVDAYLKSVGLNGGYSWCMAFVYWCVDEVARTGEGMKQCKVNPLIKTGGVLRQWNEVPRERRKTTPEQGDIFIMDFGKGTGHTGFVESVDGDSVHTIEGNTNDEGSREGYEVARRVRKIKTIKGFIRI